MDHDLRRRILFRPPRAGSPPHLLAEVELRLDGPLEGLRLTGLALWASREPGDRYGPRDPARLALTLPGRTYLTGGHRQRWSYLRGANARALRDARERIFAVFRELAGLPPP